MFDHDMFSMAGEILYEQTNAAPMGSPLSPVIANLFMEEFEKKAFKLLQC